MHESILVYRRFRYLKWALLLTIASLVVYAFHSPVEPPNGGTWLGYTLGTIGALLIFWLAWLGIKKRSYRVGTVKLEDWVSAHVYLGLALIFVATLHTGYQFGWNVHTLAYTLMMLVILSGVFGLYAYVRYPRLMTDNRRGATLGSLFSEIAELDRECIEIGAQLTDEIRDLMLYASEKTSIGGSIWRQLSGTDPEYATQSALTKLRELARTLPPAQSALGRQLLTLLSRKAELVQRARTDVQYKAMMDVWLYVHVPLTFALMVALVTHIISVFFYW
ncbi:MAG: hypothetical protein O3A21_01900 [Proteobacteria bacterium]|nr:hypothetical protein [Pseudomonadota bacterium]